MFPGLQSEEYVTATGKRGQYILRISPDLRRPFSSGFPLTPLIIPD